MRVRRNLTEGRIRFARRLRNGATQGERRLWRVLRRQNLAYRFRRQRIANRYVLDFYCPELRLCFEVDGDRHDAVKDFERDAIMAKQGVKTVRIPSLHLFAHDAEAVSFLLAAIEERCAELGVEFRRGK